MSFVKDIYIPTYYPLLKRRADGFLKIFEELENMKKNKYLILETGTCRIPNNWEGDGQSTRLWNAFLEYNKNGKCYSVDIDPNACLIAKEMINTNYIDIICQNSISYLESIPENIKFDLIYLDSYDLDLNNIHPSSMHHVRELLSVIHKNTTPNTILSIDDHYNGNGKGKYISEWINDIGFKTIYEGYQVVYKLSK